MKEKPKFKIDIDYRTKKGKQLRNDANIVYAMFCADVLKELDKQK